MNHLSFLDDIVLIGNIVKELKATVLIGNNVKELKATLEELQIQSKHIGLDMNSSKIKINSE